MSLLYYGVRSPWPAFCSLIYRYRYLIQVVIILMAPGYLSATHCSGNHFNEMENPVNGITLLMPPDRYVDCGWIPPAEAPVISTTCSSPAALQLEEQRINGNCTYSYNLLRIWRAWDICQNTARDTQIIYVRDTMAPCLKFTDPLLMQYEDGDTLRLACDVPMNFDRSDVLVYDNCDQQVQIEFWDYLTETPNCEAKDYYRQMICRWIATDACQNADTITLVMQIIDTVPPVFTFAPDTIHVSCTNIENTNNISVADNCSENVYYSQVDTVMPGRCLGEMMIRRTLIAYDDCHNRATKPQIVFVTDTVAPVLEHTPDDLTLDCGVPIPAPSTTIRAIDNCDSTSMLLRLNESTSGDICNRIIQRTWTATDECGNQSFFTQTITVIDTLPPVVMAAPLALDTMNCDDPIPTDVPVFKDACSDSLTLTSISSIRDLDCGFLVEKAWTATDLCGNSTTVTQVIVAIDEQAPVFVNIPNDTVVDCAALFPADTLLAYDNCDTIVDIEFREERTGTLCDNLEIRRIWTATDDCGNSTVAEQIIAVSDFEKPVFTSVPADTLVACTDIPAVADVTATDNCDTALQVSFTEHIASDSCRSVITRRWIATDDCGNATTAEQIITVSDFTAPVLQFVAPQLTGVTHGDTLVYPCDAVPQFDATAVLATDNCDSTLTVNYSEQTTPADNCARDGFQSVVESRWTVEDACGNTAGIAITIIIIDTLAPKLLAIPGDTIIACSAAVPPPPDILAEDNCDSDLTVVFEESVADDGCEKIITRSWKTVDDCGNSTTGEQKIILIDTVAPVVISAPADTVIDCAATEPQDAPVFEDNCSGILNIELSASITFDSCGFTIEKVWTATDSCGNATTVSRTIRGIDTLPPVLDNIPPDATVACADIPAPAAVTAADICSDSVIILFNESEIFINACDRQLERTWTAIDACGNAASATQILTVIDTTGPVFLLMPADTVVSCDAVPAPVNMVALDNCSDSLNIIFDEEFVRDSCAGSYTLSRLWTAVDACGNSAIWLRHVRVTDTIAPLIQFSDTSLSDGDTIRYTCGNPPQLNANSVVATDNCTGVALTFEKLGAVSSDCQSSGYLESQEYRWTAADSCGNASSVHLILALIDTTAPVFSGVPPSMVLTCEQPIPAADSIRITDNCNFGVSLSMQELVDRDTCRNSYRLSRLWYATDFCGNSTTASQVIEIIDTVAPEIVGLPTDTTVACEAVPDPASVSVRDNCDANPFINFVETTTPGDCPQAYLLERRWTLTDACGNSAVFDQVLTVIDTTPPVFDAAPDTIILQCGDAIPPVDTIAITDNCDPAPVLLFEEIQTTGGCAFSREISRIWTAADACGNENIFIQRIIITDTIAPDAADIPQDLRVDCTDSLSTYGDPVFTDNCDTALTVQYSEQRIDGNCPGAYELLRTWRATDDCGNETIVTQTILFRDITAPQFDRIPADTSVDCTGVVLPAMPVVSDNCDTSFTLELAFDTLPGMCPQEYTIQRIWTATDHCGNSNTEVQNIHVRDTTAPVLTLLDSTLIGKQDGDTLYWECDDLMIFNENDARATDDCGIPVITFSEEITASGNCASDGFIKQLICKWTADDGCGNRDSISLIMIIQDDTPPQFVDLPADTLVACWSEVPSADSVAITDNCNNAPITVEVEETVLSGNCPDEGRVNRIWTVTDFCGNSTSFVQSITVKDTVAPSLQLDLFGLVNIPNGDTLSIACDELVPVDTQHIHAQDNCGIPDLSFSIETIAGDSCAQSGYLSFYHYQWRATDRCGNASVFNLYVKVVDFVPPVISGVPADTTLFFAKGDTIPAMPAVIVADQCQDSVDIEFTEVVQSDTCGQSLRRTWLAADHCGNITRNTQFIRMSAQFEIDTIIIESGSCGLADNRATINLTGDAANYEFSWSPDVGQSITYDNARRNLPPGDYIVTVNVKAYPACRQEISFTIEDPCFKTEIDTIYVDVEEEQTSSFCLDFDILENRSPVTDAIICGAGDVNTVALIDITERCFTLEPAPGFLGESPDTVCFIHCFERGDCDETIVIITVMPAQPKPCADVPRPFAANQFSKSINDCEGSKTICIDMPQADLNDFAFRSETPLERRACSTEYHPAYSLADIPGNGDDGPYRILEWKVNGENFSGYFQHTAALLYWMRQVDPQGDWQLNGFDLWAGAVSADYGPLRIKHQLSGQTFRLDVSAYPLSRGLSFQLPEGIHKIYSTYTPTGCQDSTEIGIYCLTTEEQYEQVLLHTERFVCVALDELPGQLQTLKVDENTPASPCIDVTAMPESGCLKIRGEKEGKERICVVACDETELCDTTFVNVEVRTELKTDRPDLIVNNGFSPNGDGINDTFIIKNIEAYPNSRLQVFNRWGSRVLNVSAGYDNSWDGTWNDTALPDGTYYYLLYDGFENTRSGYLQLQR